jgi:hypothetical protein
MRSSPFDQTFPTILAVKEFLTKNTLGIWKSSTYGLGLQRVWYPAETSCSRKKKEDLSLFLKRRENGHFLFLKRRENGHFLSRRLCFQNSGESVCKRSVYRGLTFKQASGGARSYSDEAPGALFDIPPPKPSESIHTDSAGQSAVPLTCTRTPCCPAAPQR